MFISNYKRCFPYELISLKGVYVKGSYGKNNIQ